jgi:hypothetical protein
MTPPEDGFKEAETYVGVFFKCFEETLYIGFLNKVYLVGDKTLIRRNDPPFRLIRFFVLIFH